RVERIGRELEEDLTRLGEEAVRNQEACRAEHEARLAAVENRLREELAVLRTEWDVRVKPLHRHLAGLEERFPVADGTGRRTTGGVGAVLPVGRIRVILENLVGGLPDGEGFGLEGNADFDIPLALGFPGRTLLVADGAADEVAGVFERMAARAATFSSPGSWKITIFDPDDASSRF